MHPQRSFSDRYFNVILGVLCVLALAAIFTVPAFAQTTRTATITFTRPATYTDGSTIPTGTAISYEVLQGAKGSTTKPIVATITNVSTTISTGLQPGETCWQVVAVINGVKSAVSNEACKTFPFPIPEAVTITVT